MPCKSFILKLFFIVIGGMGCGGAHSDPVRSATRLDLAKDFLRKGNLEAAEQEANRALAYQRGNEEAENVLGLVYLVRGMEDFRLLEVDGCLTGVDAESMHQDLDQALTTADQHFARAVAFASDFGEAWANRGVVAIHLGNYEAASQYLSTALGFPQRLIDIGIARAHLGWAYFYLGNYLKAAKELLQAYQFRPGSCVATYRLGRVYFARKEWEKAADKFQEVSDQPSCPLQEARLFLMKSIYERERQGSLPGSDQGDDTMELARAACLALSPESCIAAECRSLGRSLPPGATYN